MSPIIPCPAGHPAAKRTSKVEVVATGFGPFGTMDPNPSWEVLLQLPPLIPSDTGNGPDIIIHKHPEPVPVSYRRVSELLSKLYGTLQSVQYFVHIGVHAKVDRCKLERQVKKGPYIKLDVDGRHFADGFDDEDGIWESGPAVIKSEVDVDAIVERMISGSDEWQIGASDDPGLYLCEFIYYWSLARARRLKKEGPDLKGIFVHVPPFFDAKSLGKEGDTITEVIREMVNQDQGGNSSPN